MTTAVTGLDASSALAPVTANNSAGADRFLKLLVAQMQNQDPLNPMDNAQITSQMAQINTVAGIEQLNGTVQALNAQFVQMQALQGAALVGRDVTLPGNALQVDAGVAQGAFEIAGAADRVVVEVLDPSGRVAERIDLGAMSAGRHSFDWDASGVANPAGWTFRVQATAGATAVASQPLMFDRVEAVRTEGSTLILELAREGSVPYSAVQAFH